MNVASQHCCMMTMMMLVDDDAGCYGDEDKECDGNADVLMQHEMIEREDWSCFDSNVGDNDDDVHVVDDGDDAVVGDGYDDNSDLVTVEYGDDACSGSGGNDDMHIQSRQLQVVDQVGVLVVDALLQQDVAAHIAVLHNVPWQAH